MPDVDRDARYSTPADPAAASTPHPYFCAAPMVLAHRGASAYAPDHTLAALRLALEQGSDAIEIDAHLTRDGEVVLHHSGELSENTDGRGRIGRYTLSELRRLDVGYRWSPDGGRTFPYRGRGERLITLSETLQAFPGARFNLEIKERRAAEPVRRVLDAHAAHERVLLAAWYSWRRASALVGYRGPHGVTLDEMAVFLLLHHVHLERIWGRRVDALQIPERYKGLRVVTPRLIERAHRLGLRVHVWTVNGEADMRRLLDWGVDGLITNRPDLALRVRAQQTGKH